MKASLRALLTGVIDYAGLFPPAQLPLQQSIQNDAAYRKGPDAWMLGRFVCPAAKLKDLSEFPPLSVVGRGGATMTDVLKGLQDDLLNMSELRHRQPGAVIDAYEFRLSSELIGTGHDAEVRKALFTQLQRLAEHSTDAKVPSIDVKNVFIELEYGPRWTSSVDAQASAFVNSPNPPKGLKIRCGGATAASVPSTSDVAFALATCRTAGLPVKFTAGLHHPVRRDDSSLGTKTHGFFNVFVAGVLGHARGIDVDTLQAIIEEEEPNQFRFEDSGLSWKDMHATTEEVIAARKYAVISFGSCSFDEPREDLQTLGLMP
jgi:hypothetical protein